MNRRHAINAINEIVWFLAQSRKWSRTEPDERSSLSRPLMWLLLIIHDDCFFLLLLLLTRFREFGFLYSTAIHIFRVKLKRTKSEKSSKIIFLVLRGSVCGPERASERESESKRIKIVSVNCFPRDWGAQKSILWLHANISILLRNLTISSALNRQIYLIAPILLSVYCLIPLA